MSLRVIVIRMAFSVNRFLPLIELPSESFLTKPFWRTREPEDSEAAVRTKSAPHPSRDLPGCETNLDDVHWTLTSRCETILPCSGDASGGLFAVFVAAMALVAWDQKEGVNVAIRQLAQRRDLATIIDIGCGHQLHSRVRT